MRGKQKKIPLTPRLRALMATTKHETAEVLAMPATHQAQPRRKLPAMTATVNKKTKFRLWSNF
jgi:hypothetical protein